MSKLWYHGKLFHDAGFNLPITLSSAEEYRVALKFDAAHWYMPSSFFASRVLIVKTLLEMTTRPDAEGKT